jgi:hypothetical protein
MVDRVAIEPVGAGFVQSSLDFGRLASILFNMSHSGRSECR